MSLRVRRGFGLVPIQLLAPRWKPGVGSGYMLSSAIPFGLRRSAGITLPGKGCPVSGSRTSTWRPKNGLVALNSSLKSPRRMAAVGTVRVFVSSRS